jgi:hypothetical protein
VSLWDTLTFAAAAWWESAGVRAAELLQADPSSSAGLGLGLGFHMVAALDDELAVRTETWLNCCRECRWLIRVDVRAGV